MLKTGTQPDRHKTSGLGICQLNSTSDHCQPGVLVS